MLAFQLYLSDILGSIAFHKMPGMNGTRLIPVAGLSSLIFDALFGVKRVRLFATNPSLWVWHCGKFGGHVGMPSERLAKRMAQGMLPQVNSLASFVWRAQAVRAMKRM